MPPDQNAANDTWPDSTTATPNAYSYVRGLPFGIDLDATSKVGTSSLGGTLLMRFPLREPALVSEVRLFMSADYYSNGETVYGVVMDEAGHVLGRSADHRINTADQNQWLACPLTQPVRTTGRAMLAGMACMPGRLVDPRTGTRNSYDPILSQGEPTPRDSMRYQGYGDSARLGLSPPRYFAQYRGRLMVEVVLQTAPLAVRPSAAPWLPDIWPNPAHGQVSIAVPAGTTAPVWATLLDATGRVVLAETRLRAGVGTATLPLAGVQPGLYVVRLRAPDWQHSQQLVVE